MRRLALAAALAMTSVLGALGTAPVRAQSSEAPGHLDPELRAEAERLARESMSKMIEAMDKFLRSIPQYDLPEITPEGDIIIRRRPAPPVPGRAPEEPDATDI
jgi:hypothetical protein